MKHYVYKLENPETGEYYFGSRSCRCKIEDDDYMGSMKTWQPDKSRLVKTILRDDFDTRDEATLYEMEIIVENYKDKLNKNYSIPNTGFYSGGEPETNPNYGNRRNEEWKKEQSERMVEYYQSHKPPRLGETHTEEAKKKLSEYAAKRFSNRKNHPKYGTGEAVLQCDKDGNIIKEWISGMEAARHFGVNRENIYRCLQGKYKSSCGFIWKYKK